MRQHFVADVRVRLGGAECWSDAPSKAPGSIWARRIGTDVETLSMLNSAAWRIRRPTVLVTESGIPESRSPFLSAPGLECLRAPDDEADLASALREAPAASRDRRARDRTPERCTTRCRRVASSRDSASDTTASTSAKPRRPVSSAPTRRASSISRWPNTRCCSSPPRRGRCSPCQRA